MVDESLTSSPTFWAALIGGVTGVTGLVVGRKSRPLDKADTAARIGDAWDRIAVQLTADNQTLRSEVAVLKAEAHTCKDELEQLREMSHYNSRRHDALIDYLSSLGLEAPPDAESSPDNPRSNNDHPYQK